MSPNNYSFLDKPILGWLYCNKGKILYVNNSDQTVVALKSVIFFSSRNTHTLNTNVKKLLKEHFNSLNINSTIFYWSPLFFTYFQLKYLLMLVVVYSGWSVSASRQEQYCVTHEPRDPKLNVCTKPQSEDVR